MTGPSTTFTYRVRYAETDQMGSYYNARALEWFEMGRTELSHAMGLPYTEWEKRGIFMPLIEASVKFQGRATYDDLLEMTVSAEVVGRTRLKFSNTVVHAASRKPVCSGWTMHALLDRRGVPQRIPDWVIELMDRTARVIALIDRANGEDPRTESWKGIPRPKELLYGQRMSEWLARLEPNASELLRIAVRAQHLRRWEIPRGDYPEGRAGYLRWRAELGRFHAERAGELMREAGYEEEQVVRVRDLIQKKRLKEDPEAQTLEDVACLVFLEFYFADFAPDHDEEKVIGILRKTWAKMSPRAHEAALALALPEQARKLVEKALAE